MKKIFGMLLICAFSFASCGDDEPEVSCTIIGFNTELNAAVDKVNAAITTFNADNTVENCEALKEAADEYVEAVQDFKDCTEISASDYADALQAAENARDMIVC